MMRVHRRKLMFLLMMVLCALPAKVYAQDQKTNAAETTATEAPKPSTSGALRIAIPKQAVDEIVKEDAAEEAAVNGGDEILSDNPDLNLILLRIKSVAPEVNPSQIPSLFFTTGEHNLIADARKGLVARPATETEIAESEEQQEKGQRPPRGPRELALGGIVYASAGDWTIWLNGQKITPKRIPPEILDIRVNKDTVSLKWFDAYTNQIFPVKLKSHQRFNIDTRIFLPG